MPILHPGLADKMNHFDLVKIALGGFNGVIVAGVIGTGLIVLIFTRKAMESRQQSDSGVSVGDVSLDK